MSLFVAGAIFGDVGVSLFVAGGDVADSLVVDGATCGKIWADSGGATSFLHSECSSKAGK